MRPAKQTYGWFAPALFGSLAAIVITIVFIAVGYALFELNHG